MRSPSAQSGEDGQGFLSDVRRAAPSTALDSTTQLPGQVDALLSEDEPLIRPNIGRQPSSDAENVLSATVPAPSGALRAAGLTAMPSEHGSRVTCPATQVLNQAGVTCLNRFAPLGEDAEGIPVPSRGIRDDRVF